MHQMMVSNTMTVIINGKEFKDMSDSMLQEYIGKDCSVWTFNSVGGVKGKLMAADSEWVKIKTKKGNIQIVNKNMIMTINFDLDQN